MAFPQQQSTRNSVFNNRRDIDGQLENGSFPSAKPDFFKKLESFQISEYNKNSTQVLQTLENKEKPFKKVRKQSHTNQPSQRTFSPKTVRTGMRESFSKIGISNIKDKIRINYSLYGIKPIGKKKRAQSVTKKRRKIPIGPPYKLLHMLENLYESKQNQESNILSSKENLKMAEKNFEET